jgi:hypothetical protein
MRVPLVTEDGLPAGETDVPEDVHAAASLVRSWMAEKGCEQLSGLSTRAFNLPPSMPTRRYLPGFADLVDRMSIVLQKEVFLHEHRDDYRAEMALIMHDINLILKDKPPLGAEEIRAVITLQLANRWVWENETHIRDGTSTEPDHVQLRRLKGTHAVNGVRNTAKNVLAAFDGGRRDYKIDALSADLPLEFGNWRIFEQ